MNTSLRDSQGSEVCHQNSHSSTIRVSSHGGKRWTRLLRREWGQLLAHLHNGTFEQLLFKFSTSSQMPHFISFFGIAFKTELGALTIQAFPLQVPEIIPVLFPLLPVSSFTYRWFPGSHCIKVFLFPNNSVWCWLCWVNLLLLHRLLNFYSSLGRTLLPATWIPKTCPTFSHPPPYSDPHRWIFGEPPPPRAAPDQEGEELNSISTGWLVTSCAL